MSNTITPVEPYYLTTNLAKLSRDICKLNFSSIGGVQRFYFIANAFVRSASELRRLNIASRDVSHEMFLFDLSLSSALVSLPDVPQEPTFGLHADVKTAKDRIIAESIILVHL